MNCRTVWEDNLRWLLDCLEAKICLYGEAAVNVKLLREKIRSDFFNMNFRDYLVKKILVRNMFLKFNSSSCIDSWISKKINIDGYRITFNTKDDTYYERTAKSDLEIAYTNCFIKEFIGNKIDNSQYKLLLTNSGMSAILLALHFCRILGKADKIIVQSEMYYEINPVLKTIFRHIEYEDVEQIYHSMLSSANSCYFLGYTKNSVITNILSAQKLIDVLYEVNSDRPIFVIVDRTYFSLDDIFYEQLSKLSEKNNITVISVESLLKHYQYGMEMTALGAVFVYSKKCRSKIYTDLISSLCNSLGVRLSPILYARLFPFNRTVLTDTFLLSCHNARYLYNCLHDNSIMSIGHMKNNRVKWGDLLYLPMTSVQQCHDVISYIQKAGIVMHGQSFGLDMTRVCCEENVKTQEVKLRISLGTEDEGTISRLGEVVSDALRKCRAL